MLKCINSFYMNQLVEFSRLTYNIFTVPNEAVAFLSAVGVFLVCLIVFYCYLNKVWVIPCISMPFLTRISYIILS